MSDFLGKLKIIMYITYLPYIVIMCLMDNYGVQGIYKMVFLGYFAVVPLISFFEKDITEIKKIDKIFIITMRIVLIALLVGYIYNMITNVLPDICSGARKIHVTNNSYDVYIKESKNVNQRDKCMLQISLDDKKQETEIGYDNYNILKEYKHDIEIYFYYRTNIIKKIEVD